jgi:predicted nucleotidyltransferase
MNQAEVLTILKAFKDKYARQYCITKIGIFGSAARDQLRNESDIDIVVKMEKPDIFHLVHIKDELQLKYHRKVDIVHYREKMNPFLKERIEQEALYV